MYYIQCSVLQSIFMKIPQKKLKQEGKEVEQNADIVILDKIYLKMYEITCVKMEIHIFFTTLKHSK